MSRTSRCSGRCWATASASPRPAIRRAFYDNLLNDYFDKERTILVTTHQVEEIENILTDVIFIQHGKIVLDSPMEALGERFAQLVPATGNVERARALKPIDERDVFGRAAMLFDGCNRAELESLGEVRIPSVPDLFVAMMQPGPRAGGIAEGGRMSTMLLMVRREFWEHRSLWIAPLVWAGIIIVLSAWVFLFLIPKHAPAGALEATHVEEIQGLNADDRKELSQAIETGKAHGGESHGLLFVPRHFAADLDFHQHRGVLLPDRLPVQRTARSKHSFLEIIAAIRLTDRPVEARSCAGRGTSWSTRAGRRHAVGALFDFLAAVRGTLFGNVLADLNSSAGFRPWSSNSPSCCAVSSGTHPSLPTS